jgi:hypothetical protein
MAGVGAFTASASVVTARVLTDAEQIAAAFRENGASVAELTRVLARIHQRMELAEQRAEDNEQSGRAEKQKTERREREKMVYIRLAAVIGVITFIVTMTKATNEPTEPASAPAAVKIDQSNPTPLGAIERIVEGWIRQFDQEDTPPAGTGDAG